MCSAFNSLLAQTSGLPATPQRLARQSDVSKDAVLKTVCESVQSALNMPYISERPPHASTLNMPCLMERLPHAHLFRCVYPIHSASRPES